MGHNHSEEKALIPIYTIPASTPKFPLNFAPECARPYLELIRLEKPTGTILMFWPFAWGLTMAAFRVQTPPSRYAVKLAECLIGAFLLRGSACTVNDIFDRHVDAGVERTRNRPLPSGRITVTATYTFLSMQYALGITFFCFTVEKLALWVALFQLLPLFAIYPLLKRYTHWPQAWLGFAMNFGFITAWIAMTGLVDVPLLLTSVTACWCWTMLYDTIYACQDIQDDVKMGVCSTAILFGEWIRPLLVCCGSTFLFLLAVAGFINKQSYAYFVFSVGGTASHLVWQYFTVDLDIPRSCWQNFNRNGHLGWIIWTGLMFDYLFSLQII
ncbi:UbiA prenyltransferase family [Gymnopilus junonius]|uniref:4-hydroxybenzoate polyprenyltransferase, mitochondrial n=1 Tax=Gymnopilus junonius TaxID=109634 RepID=A0A9P5NXK8_GYMJU|nr:UbiA prenyltransferase family [Gymnopilus junonius]